MNLYTALGHRLSNYSGLSALVGARIYAIKLPQNVTYPAVTFQVISGLPRTHLMGSDDSLAAPRVQVSAWDTSLTDATAVADQIKAALQDFTGTMGGDGGITVQRIFLESEQILIFDPEVDVIQIAQDFLIWREES
jgi:hypothetical protein